MLIFFWQTDTVIPPDPEPILNLGGFFWIAEKKKKREKIESVVKKYLTTEIDKIKEEDLEQFVTLIVDKKAKLVEQQEPYKLNYKSGKKKKDVTKYLQAIFKKLDKEQKEYEDDMYKALILLNIL